MKPDSCKKPLILLCLTLLLLACSREKVPQLSYLSSEAVILAFGDSLTHGTGAKSDQAYPAILQARVQRKVAVEATPGITTRDALPKLAPALQRHQPDLVILCLGGNDFLRKYPLSQTRDNLDRMISQIRAFGSELVLLGVPKPGLFGLDGHELYEELANTHQLVLDNETIADLLSDKSLKSDAIHPNAAGYRRLADKLSALLERAGAI